MLVDSSIVFKQLAVLELYSSSAAAPVLLALAGPVRNKSSCIYAIPLAAFERHQSASSMCSGSGSASYSVQSGATASASGARAGTSPHASVGSSLSITSSTFAAPLSSSSSGQQQQQQAATSTTNASAITCGCTPAPASAPTTSGAGNTQATNTASSSSICSCLPSAPANSGAQDNGLNSNPVAISSVAPVDSQNKYACATSCMNGIKIYV